MSDISKEIGSLSPEPYYPEELSNDFSLLECFSSRNGRETFLAVSKQSGEQAIVKCYEKSIYSLSPETELLENLDHPGIPKAMGFYENETMLCIVREYIEGVTLDRYMKENRPTQNEIISVCIGLADILIYLHTRPRPVIHRDVKPENVIVSEDGAVSLIDFDIARTVREGADSDTCCFGTREYASPEQYGFRQTDRRSDIYSFGVLLRYMLTGKTHGDADSDIPTSLRHIVDKCTAFDPKDRYDSMKSVKTALENVRRTGNEGKLRITLAAVFVAAWLCAAFVLGRQSGRNDTAALPAASGAMTVQTEESVPETKTAAPAQSVFAEPLIEKAVRVQLGISDDEPLPEEKLSEIRKLYIFGTETAKTFDELGNFYVENTMRGDISTLSDLSLLVNLEELFIANQGSLDISALSEAGCLRLLTLKHLTVIDPTPLGNIKTLTGAYLFDCGISDFTALCGCEKLEELDAGKNPVTTMERIGVHPRLRSLSLKFLNMETLDGLEKMPELDTLYLSGAVIADVTAVGKLPELRYVYATGETFDAVSALTDGGRVELICA